MQDLNLSDSNTLLLVTSGQLADFARLIVNECREEQAQAQDEDSWITAKEAAVMLGVTKPTLWRWQRENYLVPTMRGSRNFYRKCDIKKLMEGRR